MLGLKRKIVIFGGLGFIGHRLALALSKPHQVYVVDNCRCVEGYSQEFSKRADLLKASGVIVHDIDIFDECRMSAFLDSVTIDVVFHLAGASSVAQTYECDGFNQIIGVTNELLKHLSQSKIERIIYFSSSMVYGNFCASSINEAHAKKPVDKYGAFKFASEVLIESWARHNSAISIIVRPTAVYGPFDIKYRVVSKFLNRASQGQKIVVQDDGSSELDFTYVDDVVSAAVLTLEHPHSDDFNISFGHSRSFQELVGLIRGLYSELDVVYSCDESYPVAKRGSLNSDKAIRLLGYQPKYTLEKGLSKLLKLESASVSLCSEEVSAFPVVPLAKADILPTDVEAVNKALQTGWFTAGLPNIIFESQFVKYLELENGYALSLNSCASALELAIRAHDISGKVIVPAFTFSATANAVIRAGATPQFVDIESIYLGLDPLKLERSILPDTEAIVVVHLAGTICDINPIISIAKRYDLKVIEDCAQALGAGINGKHAGTFGDVACFSFFPTKMITTGEGGMLVTKSEKVFNRAKAMANHGYYSSTLNREEQSRPWVREQILTGSNYRMSSINASLGVSQLERVNEITQARRKKAIILVRALSKIDSIEVFEYDDRHSVYQALNVLLPEVWDRDSFTQELRVLGVMASVHYPETLSGSRVFHSYVSALSAFPVADSIASRIVTLPLFGSMSDLQINRVVDVVRIVTNKFENQQQILSC